MTTALALLGGVALFISIVVIAVLRDQNTDRSKD